MSKSRNDVVQSDLHVKVYEELDWMESARTNGIREETCLLCHSCRLSPKVPLLALNQIWKEIWGHFASGVDEAEKTWEKHNRRRD